MVDADFAELVDHDRRVGAFRAGQQFADQRRLAGPRNPVTTVTGMRAPRGRRCRRPNGLASLPANGSDIGIQLARYR